MKGLYVKGSGGADGGPYIHYNLLRYFFSGENSFFKIQTNLADC